MWSISNVYRQTQNIEIQIKSDQQLKVSETNLKHKMIFYIQIKKEFDIIMR